MRIAGPVLTVTIFATGIATAFHYGYNVTLTNSVVPLLAVVVSHSEPYFPEGIHTTSHTGWFDPCIQEYVRSFEIQHPCNPDTALSAPPMIDIMKAEKTLVR